MHYNRFRYYDPSIGRYISADPIGQNGILEDEGVGHANLSVDTRSLDVVASVNLREVGLYPYVMNNPTRWIDPEGLQVKGDDPVFQALKDAAKDGDRDTIDNIEKEYKDKKDKGEVSKKRWNKIKGWIKLAKDGRLLSGPAFQPLLVPPSAFCGQPGFEALCQPPPGCEGEL